MIRELLAALELDTIPQLSLGTAVALIFAACAVLAMLRGFLRILVGTLVLCAACFAGYLVWRHVPVTGPAWLPYVLSGIGGSVVFLVLRRVLRFASRPFGDDDQEGGSRRSGKRRWPALLFSLVPASVLSFSGMTALRNIGAVAEIRRFVDGSATNGQSQFLAELKGTIDRLAPEGVFKAIDPLAEKARVTLAKLIALGDSKTVPKAIPVLEEPEIRALVAGDPKLRQLAKERRFAEILRDPRLDEVVADPDLQRMLAGLEL